MSTYVFYVFEAGGIHLTLEVHTLASDDFAMDWARKILRQHPTAEYVTVKHDAITLATEYQFQKTNFAQADAEQRRPTAP